MKNGNTHVIFALYGNNFDIEAITDRLQITPTDSWNVGAKERYPTQSKYSCWQYSTDKGREYLWVDNLVDEVVNTFFDKIDTIIELKNQYHLDSVLEIVLYIDENEEQSTPALGHDLKTIEFLFRTQTETDVDIYLFNSAGSI